MNSASYRKPTTHAALPGQHALVPVCYHYDAGRLSYDGMMLSLLEGRVMRRRGFNCRSCHAVFTKFPQLANLFDEKARSL